MQEDQLASIIVEILETVQANARRFQAEARKRGIRVTQLTAAAIMEVVRQHVEATNKRKSN